MERFTKIQGQYLAFIAAYAKLNRRPPGIFPGIIAVCSQHDRDA
jgi:hypothetical protein